MNEKIKKNLFPILILVIIASYGVYFYISTTKENFPGESDYRMGNALLEDKKFKESIPLFDKSLSINNKLDAAFLGKGISLMYMNKLEESKINMDKAIKVNNKFAEAYANRGILHDRMGRYEDAVRDYVAAIRLKPKLNEGPGWIWRFLRNIDEKPASILERVQYIQQELKKPLSERKLKLKDKDDAQKLYTPGKIL